MNHNTLNRALETLGSLIENKGLHYEVVAIGGGSLLLLGMIIRPTNDLDLVALIENSTLISPRPLPSPLIQSISEVSSALRLPKDWINTAPADLWEMGLPDGFQNRLHPINYGGGLTLYCASRYDQICFKLYATVDQGHDSKHYTDLKMLNPTNEELISAAEWCKTHDVSEPFAQCLNQLLLQLKE